MVQIKTKLPMDNMDHFQKRKKKIQWCKSLSSLLDGGDQF
jgi:hypothetical protein